MARRRRRKKSGEPDDLDDLEAVESEDADPSLDPTPPSPEARAQRDLAELCLVHPSRPLVQTCDDCAEALCTMCALDIRGASLCARCFEKRFHDGRLRGHAWQGWAAMAVSFLAIGALLGAFALPDAVPLLHAMPGGRVGLVILASLAGATSVLLGFSAQDFGGMGGRAGWVGVVFGVLVVLCVIGLNLLAVTGV